MYSRLPILKQDSIKCHVTLHSHNVINVSPVLLLWAWPVPKPFLLNCIQSFVSFINELCPGSFFYYYYYFPWPPTWLILSSPKRILINPTNLWRNLTNPIYTWRKSDYSPDQSCSVLEEFWLILPISLPVPEEILNNPTISWWNSANSCLPLELLFLFVPASNIFS